MVMTVMVATPLGRGRSAPLLVTIGGILRDQMYPAIPPAERLQGADSKSRKAISQLLTSMPRARCDGLTRSRRAAAPTAGQANQWL
jgi:hypothetical protein